jgi:hypothetical protein
MRERFMVQGRDPKLSGTETAEEVTARVVGPTEARVA